MVRWRIGESSLKPFLEAIDERVLVCDGAMGTQLYAKGVFINRCFESLNLTDPDLVGGVHAEYLRAGADVVETNTFGANRIKLRAFGLSEKVAAINLEGRARATGARAHARDEGLCRRRDRPARHSRRALGQDRRRRGGAVFQRAGQRRCSKAASTCSCSRRSAI